MKIRFSLRNHVVENLKRLKLPVIKWEKQKKKEMKADLLDIEYRIKEIYYANISCVFSKSEKRSLGEHKARKIKSLAIEEEAWRLKSSAI